MKVRRIAAFLLAGILLAYCCAGCSDTAKKEEPPTTITVWHVYGGQTDSPLNDLIDAFNQTVGKEQRINVQVTSVSNTNTIHSVVYDLTDRSVLWVGNEHYGEDGYTFEFQLGA